MSPLPVIHACPQCKDPLAAITHGAVSALGCRGCGGTWLDHTVLDRVTAALDPESIEVSDDAAKMARLPFPPHEASPPCPICHQPLSTMILDGTNVELDVCAEHGIWFDRGELQSVIQELMAQASSPSADASAVSAGLGGGAAGYPLSDEEVRQRMISQYGIDPTQRTEKRYDEDSGDSGYGVGVDLGLSILGFLLQDPNERGYRR